MRRFAAACGTALAALAVASAPAGAVNVRDAAGQHVDSVRALDARLVAVAVESSAIPGPADVRILLPSGYASHPHRRYGVLYLLHGTSGSAADWTVSGGAEETTANRPLIVVMPDIGLNGDGGGWCTNWVQGGRERWEAFHIDQLVPWVDANLRTVRARGARAIAGLSQGGFCAMSYAARHPDLFGIALTYSGAVDTAYDAAPHAGFVAILGAIETGLDHVPAGSIFGSPVTNEINWAAHDPTTLAGNLRSTTLFLFTGNGAPGPLDPTVGLGTVGTVGASSIEAGVHLMTTQFHRRLEQLGIPSVYEDYGPGTHSWPYWARDLRESIGPVTTALSRPGAAPRTFDYTSADASYSQYGWRVTLRRRARQFSTLGGAGAGGFSLSGTGSASVTTAPKFRRGTVYAITLTDAGGRTQRLTRIVGPDRRLRIAISLGPIRYTSHVRIAVAR